MISEPLRNPLSLFDVKDKVAIVTGASGTFGRATALALTALGGKVLLASLNDPVPAPSSLREGLEALAFARFTQSFGEQH